MNFGPALLLVGAFLIAATPACADNMPQSGLVKRLQGTATSANVTSDSPMDLSVPMNARFLAQSDSAMVLTANVQVNSTFDLSTPRSPLTPRRVLHENAKHGHSLCRSESVRFRRSHFLYCTGRKGTA